MNIRNYLENPFKYSVLSLADHRKLNWLSDEKYLKLVYKAKLGEPLDLKNPQIFGEKIQWLKIYDRKPLYTNLVDKYEVKEYVAKKIGKDYVIPNFGVWDKFDDIDFKHLPSQFVLKCTHDSGGVVICKDKSTLNIESARNKIENHLKSNYYWSSREWPYKNVKPRIIAEQYLVNGTDNDVKDYKVYCFSGEPMYCQVISERSTEEHIDFFDMEWKHQEFKGFSLPHKPFKQSEISAPINFENMKSFARILSKNIPFLRVDFYEVNGKLYFGELTFYPASGFGKFKPDIWNLKLGELIKLI